MRIIKAPKPLKNIEGKTIFLAGSIEMGTAENWQQKTEKLLRDFNCTILNPRRDDWDSTWEQSIHNKQFREQVEWELDALENADLIAMYFDSNTKSPITLLELGLFIDSTDMIVCCPDGYWRKGNVDIVCDRYNYSMVQVNDFYDFVDKIILFLKRC